jgi:hypothetical protein
MTLSDIIKESPMSCCFLKSRKLVVTELQSVASGWAGSCVTITETLPELTPNARSIAMTLWLPCAETNALLTATTEAN